MNGDGCLPVLAGANARVALVWSGAKVLPSMKTLALALSLLPALAFAQAQRPSSQRVGVLLIPMDRSAEAMAPKLEGWMQEAVGQFPGAQVQKTEALFGLPDDGEAEASLQRAQRGFRESEAAFRGTDSEDALRKLSATLKEYRTAAGALKECGNFCDALVMYAVLLNKKGEVEEAKLALLDLMALEPTKELDARKYGSDIVNLRAQVAQSRSAAFRGSAIIRSRPSGARVYVDGEFQGFTPVTLSTLPVGKHLLRVERPGFKRHGQLIEVTPDEIEVQADLSPTPAWKSWDGQMDKVAQDAARGTGAALTQAGKNFGLDRAIIGTLKEVGETGATEVTVGYFDLRTGKRISHRRAVYQGDEYGQLQSEVARLVNYLMNHTAARAQQETKSSANDPLDRTSGMEDWTAEDRGGKTTGKKGTKGDPLNEVSGMEDW